MIRSKMAVNTIHINFCDGLRMSAHFEGTKCQRKISRMANLDHDFTVRSSHIMAYLENLENGRFFVFSCSV